MHPNFGCKVKFGCKVYGKDSCVSGNRYNTGHIGVTSRENSPRASAPRAALRLSLPMPPPTREDGDQSQDHEIARRVASNLNIKSRPMVSCPWTRFISVFIDAIFAYSAMFSAVNDSISRAAATKSSKSSNSNSSSRSTSSIPLPCSNSTRLCVGEGCTSSTVTTTGKF